MRNISLYHYQHISIPAGLRRQAAAAAGFPCPALTDPRGLKPGESVLIGHSGELNSASIQIIKLAGATVYVVGSNAEKLKPASRWGRLFDRCSKDENWSKTAYYLTDKHGVDVVVDNVGTTFPSSFRTAAKGGRILTVGNSGGPKFEIDNRFIFSKHLSILGSSMGTRADFATVMDLVFAGKLKAVVDRDYPLAEARFAQERLEQGEQLGKITLTVG
jgi:NADPH:quinone reductase-like Zn-dependent oxidoreductase